MLFLTGLITPRFADGCVHPVQAQLQDIPELRLRFCPYPRHSPPAEPLCKTKRLSHTLGKSLSHSIHVSDCWFSPDTLSTLKGSSPFRHDMGSIGPMHPTVNPSSRIRQALPGVWHVPGSEPVIFGRAISHFCAEKERKSGEKSGILKLCPPAKYRDRLSRAGFMQNVPIQSAAI